ncbi:NAD(+) kinase [Theileria orientalis]|uniref:NAD(+) kinase n=1 Tax=Theileria orientalis TaxID=68886 RepID=A0A976QSW0_THEOR|nr:NAD(+) kinase [Theileria orientalis]
MNRNTYEKDNFKRLFTSSECDSPIRHNSMEIVFNTKPKKILILMSPFNPKIDFVLDQLVSIIKEHLPTTEVIYDKSILSEIPETDKLWGEVQELYKGQVVTRFEDPEKADNLQEKDLEEVDLVITVGGDGTMLRVNKVFRREIPPVIGLSMGSLGYLAKFNLEKVTETLSNIETKGFKISLRSQIQVTILDENGEPIIRRNALNECVIDRGLSPYITTLDVYYNGDYFTTVSGDGLMLTTPSGSTAYSMSAGGSIVHPHVEALLFTVICPHSISYRPLVLPSTSIIKVVIPPDNRGYVRVSLDGNYSCNIRHGCSVKISTSKTNFPLVLPKQTGTTKEWCRSLKENLHWNVRIRQQKLHVPSYVKATDETTELIEFNDD